jgi:DNA-binding CsgD family transcriptional regulator
MSLEGLSEAIESQLNVWTLTSSEKEIAFLLLKGLSLREIATIRRTSEKTVRTQATCIYSKGGFGGRSELSAFFLEDLLPPMVTELKTPESTTPKAPR